MIGWKALLLTEKEGVYASGGVGGSEYYEFEVGKEYEIEGEIKLCQKGFHFVEESKLAFCLNYYNEPDKTVYAKIEATGDVKSEYEKSVTNKIKILEIVDLFGVLSKREKDKNKNTGYRNTGYWNTGNSNTGNRNTGNRNTGDCNTGDYNAGNRNTGDWNTGDCNTGDYNAGNRNTGDWNTGYWNTGDYNAGNRNTGDWNTGDCNTGDYNAGNRNTGDWNTGYWNTGDCNTGDCNTGDWNTGYFNRTTPKQIEVFEKMIDRKIWDNAGKPDFIYFELDPAITYKENWAKALTQAKSKSDWKEQYALLLALPNFNWEIFTDITGITKKICEE